MTSSRPIEIEPWSNRLAVHRLSAWLLPRAVRLGLSPNLVTATGLGFGLAAGACYAFWPDWRMAALGFLFMVGWHVMDGLDGQLARATGRTSAVGRLLDGVADYATFVAVYLALALTHPRQTEALLLAALAGLAHALQAQFYEGERATYVRRCAGRFQAEARAEAGGPFERLYNRAEALLANRTRPFDVALAALPPAARAEALGRWQPRAARILRALSPVSANGRTVAILVACLLGEPMLFWAWEILGLSVIALAAARALRQAEIVETGRDAATPRPGTC